MGHEKNIYYWKYRSADKNTVVNMQICYQHPHPSFSGIVHNTGFTWGSYVMSTRRIQAFLQTHFFIWMRVDGRPADPCKIKNIRFQKYHDSSVRNIKLLRLAKLLVAQFKYSSSLRPGTKAFTCGK